MNNSPSIIFNIPLLLDRHHQNCQANLAATNINAFMIFSCTHLAEEPGIRSLPAKWLRKDIEVIGLRHIPAKDSDAIRFS